MRIEDFWLDKIIYHVRFKVEYQSEKVIESRILNRTLIIPAEYDESMIENVILTKFKNVKSVLHIDEISEGLLLK
ncbi:hypothetical protein [Carnobacterium maltaromaticum]|uniref:hypothetical protein n=1 Tax=Carnobacterium maltaromaticum TaxID=2751 RepID=UPI00295E38F1|nr:hypothetical protein [Carnobacterium maltaromaticum]